MVPAQIDKKWVKMIHFLYCKKIKIKTHNSDQPIQYKSRSRIMGTIMEWRNAFIFPRAVPLFEVSFTAGIQRSDGLKKNVTMYN